MSYLHHEKYELLQDIEALSNTYINHVCTDEGQTILMLRSNQTVECLFRNTKKIKNCVAPKFVRLRINTSLDFIKIMKNEECVDFKSTKNYIRNCFTRNLRNCPDQLEPFVNQLFSIMYQHFKCF